MIFSKETIEILENFSSINAEIMIEAGNVIKSRSAKGSILAIATLTEKFPKTFALADLGKFLSIQKLFEKPELEFKENSIEIDSGNKKLRYAYTSPELINNKITKDIPEDNSKVKFNLSKEDIDTLLRASNGLSATHMIIKSKNGKLVVSVENMNTSSDEDSRGEFAITIGDTDQDFRFGIIIANLQILKGDYTISISSTFNPIAKKDVLISFFENKAMNLKYVVAVDPKSYIN